MKTGNHYLDIHWHHQGERVVLVGVAPVGLGGHEPDWRSQQGHSAKELADSSDAGLPVEEERNQAAP